MKTKSVLSRLGKFKSVQNEKGQLCYYPRAPSAPDRYLQVIDQDGSAVVLPIIVDADGTERVAYHPGTIYGLIDFLEGN